MIKLIVTDIDGTLVKDGTLDIKEAHGKGDTLCGMFRQTVLQ